MPRIAVVGSVNMDVVNLVHRHPLPGETVHGLGTEYHPGGKGANQAVAAARSGGEVAMLAAVGTDGFGEQLATSLENHGVHTECMVRKEGTSGIAFINVDDHGENLIILSSGANGRLSPKDIEPHYDTLFRSDAVLLQNEVPWETTLHALETAHTHGLLTFFNPAPAFQVPAEVLPLVDYLFVNETEAEAITTLPVANQDDAIQAASLLVDQGANHVVLTLGEHGSLYMDAAKKPVQTPAYHVSVADTTAAGDTFIGAFAVAICEAVSTPSGALSSRATSVSLTAGQVSYALRFASAAAALSVTKKGAQSSIPNRQDIEQFLLKHRD